MGIGIGECLCCHICTSSVTCEIDKGKLGECNAVDTFVSVFLLHGTEFGDVGTIEQGIEDDERNLVFHQQKVSLKRWQLQLQIVDLDTSVVEVQLN